MNLRRCAYATCGCPALALGAVGAVIPLLPAFPFLLLAAFCRSGFGMPQPVVFGDQAVQGES